jgi:hypothetical protein
MAGYILNALEGTYGVAPASGWIDYGLNDTDGHKAMQETYKRNVLRPHTAAPRLADRRIVDLGGEGTLKWDASTNGTGKFLAASASTATSAVVDGGTDAYLQSFAWTAVGPPANRSLASLVARSHEDGSTYDFWDFLGGRVRSTKIAITTTGMIVVEQDVRYKSATLLGADPERTYTTINPEYLWSWPEFRIGLTPKAGGATVYEAVKSFDLTIPNELDDDNRRIKRTDSIGMPKRKGTPAPSGTLNFNYEKSLYWEAFRSGDAFVVSVDGVAPVAVEGSTFPSLSIELGTIVFEESNDPEAKPQDYTDQQAPFVVLDDDSGDPVITWDQVTSDTAF